MTAYQPLTRIAQERLAGLIEPGDLAIDATVGNGLDTLFLARQVGPAGHIAGFDIQQSAIEHTLSQLQTAGCSERVNMYVSGHQHMLQELNDAWHGKVQAVMFNLGYLPGGDKQLTTRVDSTLTALQQARQLLRPGGVISIIAYRGHAGGLQESTRVADWLASLPTEQYRLEQIETPGPVLFLLYGNRT